MQKPNCSFSFDLEKYTHQDVMVEQKPKKTSGKITPQWKRASHSAVGCTKDHQQMGTHSKGPMNIKPV
jgi:hypothetical protein